MNNSLSLTFEDKLRQATKQRLPAPDQEFVARLRAQLARPAPAHPRPRRHPLHIAAASALALVLLVTLIIGPQNVLAALQSLLGYIPGVGFVRAELTLVEPVAVERQGITITVENLVVSTEETVLTFHIEGLPLEKAFAYCEERRVADPQDPCQTPPTNMGLQTDDGSVYEGKMIRGQGQAENEGRDWRAYLVFSPMPLGTTQATFTIDILPNMYPGIAPEDWAIPLQLQASDGQGQQPAQQPTYVTIAPTTAPTSAAPEETPTPSLQAGVELLLNAVSISEDTLALSVTVRWEEPNWHNAEIYDFNAMQSTGKGEPLPHLLTLTDAQGVQVPLTLNTLESPGTEFGAQRATYVLSADLSGQELVSPFTLSLSALQIDAYIPQEEQLSFTFTPTGDFQPGDCEPFTHSFTLYNNLVELVEVCSLEGEALNLGGGGGGGGPDFTPPPPTTYGLELRLRASDEVLSVSVIDRCENDTTNCAGGGGRGRFTPAKFLAATSLYYQQPAWPVVYYVSGMHFRLPGPWAIQFEMPSP